MFWVKLPDWPDAPEYQTMTEAAANALALFLMAKNQYVEIWTYYTGSTDRFRKASLGDNFRRNS